ncbi:hypothetical protein [Nocardioides sp. SR21]|uniref:hypothetical protein n=1 Tax=Nocardioides sp. SR21 TaxID=2919501 RepID=UPI001FAA8456|nr:hypothetical protein [Nocardioides sp. SR21]
MALPEFRVPHRRRPGWIPGAVLGVAAGLLVGAVWRYGARDVALAVTFVFVGLVAAMIGASHLRRFAVGLLVAAVIAGGLILLLG